MIRKQLFLICFVVCWFLLPLGAEPLNVMVGDLTFTRPTTWKWEAPDPRSPAVTRFIVPGGAGQAGSDMRFYGAGPEPETAAKAWQGYLASDDQKSLRTETKTVGKRTITYVFLHGSLTLPGDKPLSDQGFVGVIIPYETKFLHIRFSGPNNVVEKAIPVLKEMVEAAVSERESDINDQ